MQVATQQPIVQSKSIRAGVIGGLAESVVFGAMMAMMGMPPMIDGVMNSGEATLFLPLAA